MTLPPDDQAKMEKANPWKGKLDGECIYSETSMSQEFNEGYTAAHKDNAETIAKLEAERDEVLEAVDLMIVDRDEIYKERDRLREAIEQARLINSDFLTDGGESIGDRIERILSATLTPQGAHAIADALVENVIDTPDDEILKEVEEDHGDPEHEANIMRKIIADVKPQPADTQEVCHYMQEGDHLKRECDGAHFTVGQVKHHLDSFAPDGKCPHKDCGRTMVFSADTPCPECGGSGLKYPAPIIEMREDVPKCQLCNGTGKAQPCEVCGTVGGGGMLTDTSGTETDGYQYYCPRCSCPNCQDTRWVRDQYGERVPCDMCRTGSGRPK